MKRIFSSMRRKINNGDVSRLRTFLQVVFFILLVYGGFFRFDAGQDIPTFACPYVDEAGGTCFLMGLQHRLVIPFSQIVSFRGLAIVISLMAFLAWFVFFNKAWCGFACPLGTIQDWITRLSEKFKIKPAEYSERVFRNMGKIKYILLALLMLIPLGIANSIGGVGPLGHDWATPYCQICPARMVLPLFTGRTIELAIDFSSIAKAVLTTLGMAMTGLFFAGSIFKKRFFCQICPMSAFHYIFSRFAFLKLIKNGDKCTKCGDCYRVCEMGIREIADDVKNKNIQKDDCILCMKCVAACPEEKVLKITALGKSIYESTEEGFFERERRKTKNGNN